VTPSPLIIKVCGITRPEDGLAALAFGADWLGFIRWPKSPRYLPLEDCAQLVHHLRERATKPFEAVAVYVDASRDLIEREIKAIGLDRIQLHGQEPAELAAALSRPAIKALRVRDAASLARAGEYPAMDLMVDAWVAGNPGGTGQTFDWEVACAAKECGRPLILAGGLTPENVAEAVRRVRPYAVDVSSGVESAPGRKDAERVRVFLDAVQWADAARRLDAPGDFSGPAAAGRRP
jgi:phosphoribosylanthranilate isomerase